MRPEEHPGPAQKVRLDIRTGLLVSVFLLGYIAVMLTFIYFKLP